MNYDANNIVLPSYSLFDKRFLLKRIKFEYF